MDIVKIGRVELTEKECEQYYDNNLYIVTYSKIYQIMYSTAQKRYYGHTVYSNNGGMTRRGRFYAITAREINRFLGFNLLIA